MDAWILLSIVAAAFQTLRFMLQKQLSLGTLSAGGATLARFYYAAPFVVVLTVAVLIWEGIGLPALSAWFWIYAIVGGLTQIAGTWCVVLLFAQRNFAVGITLKKTEVVQTALVGFAVLGDRISLQGMIAILLGLVAVLILSHTPGTAGPRRILSRAAVIGLLSGVMFAISAIGYRGATLEVAHDMPLIRALVALSVVLVSQVLMAGLWLMWREPGQVAKVWGARRVALWIGLAGMGGSLCWFTAFTLQNAAYVFAVGQVEVMFSLLASVLFFHERVSGRELLGIAVLAASVIWLALMG